MAKAIGIDLEAPAHVMNNNGGQRPTSSRAGGSCVQYQALPWATLVGREQGPCA